MLGPKTRSYLDLDWFDENDSATDEFLVIKNKAYMESQKHPDSILNKDRFTSYQTLVKKGVAEDA